MDAPALRRRIVEALLDKVEETRFPSVTMLNRVEASLGTPEEIAEYAEILVKKVEKSRYPSTEMLNRLDQLASQLPVAQTSD
jgi:HEPN domain-containing protein